MRQRSEALALSIRARVRIGEGGGGATRSCHARQLHCASRTFERISSEFRERRPGRNECTGRAFTALLALQSSAVVFSP